MLAPYTLCKVATERKIHGMHNKSMHALLHQVSIATLRRTIHAWIAQIHTLRITAGQSMECATNPYFVAQSIDRYVARDNPWIAQIHTLPITFTEQGSVR